MLKRLATGVGVNIFDKLIIAGLQLATVPLLATVWGLDRYGMWIMLSSIPSFFANGDLGFATAAGTKMTIANARGERAQAIRIFHSAWLAILISSLVFVTLAVTLTWSLPTRLFGTDHALSEHDMRMTLMLLLLYGIAAVQGSIFFAGFRAAEKFAVGAFWNAIIIVIESGSMLCIIGLFHAQPPVAAGTLLAGRIVGLVGQNILLRKTVPWLPIGLAHAHWAEVRSLIAPASAVMLLPIAQACMLQGTSLALAAAAGPAAVPIFTATRTLSRIGLQLCWTVNAAMMPEVSAALGRRDKDAIALLVFIMLLTSAAMSVPYALGFAVLGKWAVTIWSAHIIVPGLSLVLTMALGIVCLGLWFPLSNLLLAADQQQSYTLLYLVLAAVTVPAAYGLSRVFGATGASIAMASTDLLMLVAVIRLTRIHLSSFTDIHLAGLRALAQSRDMLRKRKV